MQLLQLLVLFISLIFSEQKSVSPHGTAFNVSCNTCHSSKGWQFDKSVYSFNHNTTKFPLNGQHTTVGCRQCHQSLIFANTKNKCYECHNDVHQASVGSDCARCHTSSSWLVNDISELHQLSRFPLLGVHKTAECSRCHKSESSARYDVPGINCIDCHSENYMATTNPNHNQLGMPQDCAFCHPASSFQWTGAGFNHNVFPLVQAHSTVKCAECHTTTIYTDAKPDCFSCHQKDYASTKNPDHISSKFSIACLDCHTMNSGWKPTSFDHSSFPLELGHSTSSCIDCHIGGNYITTPADCFACHQQDYIRTTNPNHNKSGFSKTCKNCHTVDPGWKPANFDHNLFPLKLGHSTPVCLDCHSGGNYNSTSPNCISCHQHDYSSTSNPNHSSSGFPNTCTLCHTTNPGWKPATFDHSGFPLKLGHSIPVCIDCHKGGNYSSTSTDCYSCHQEDYMGTTNPNHNRSGFSRTCKNCHTTDPGWKPANFDHSGFPLKLGHATPVCLDCHAGGNYNSTSPNCISCHQRDYSSTTNPNHISSGFPNTCTQCHTTNPGWKPTTLDHSGFPLKLGHSIPECVDCHKGGNYTTTSTDCYSCHEQDYLGTKIPDHNLSLFSKTCTQCHNINPGWRPTTFNHSAFPLKLGHSISSCVECHKGGNYTATPIDCFSCHQQDFLGTANPSHKAAGFSNICQTCHTINPGWKPASFVHSGFPLTLGHSAQTCIDCHKGEDYTTIQTDCSFCHQADYDKTVNPNHKILGFPVTCSQCHTTNPGWSPANFDHSKFSLKLGHSTPVCIDCHKGENYTNTPTDCYSCHQQDYLGSTNPGHIAAGFSNICQTCHTINPGWKPAAFSHISFPLTLGHLSPVCIDCHKEGNYTSTSTDCYSCHQQDYIGTTNPNHNASGFLKACQICHTTNPGWKPAAFTHTNFPLTLGHASPICTDCHTGGNYTTTSADCFSCHQIDYNLTINPNHKTLGFTITCSQCHTTRVGWKPATFTQHDAQSFPIYSGKHRGQWASCIDCHANLSNYSQFTCITCHEHNKTEMDDKHKGRSGYSYDSPACYRCHPRGDT